MRRFIVFISLLIFLQQGFAQAARPQRAERVARRTAQDTVAFRRAAIHPFIDSMRTDSTRRYLHGRFTVNNTQQRIPRINDPFDPYAHQAFYRRGQGRFWFFVITLIILGLYIYYRSAFPKQFTQRVRGVWNRHYFDELIADYSLSFTGGSIVCMSFSTLVMTQLGIVLVIYSRFVQLNSLVFFLVMLIGVLAWRGLVYMAQRLQAYVLDTGEDLRIMMQRQISVDMWVAFLVFPVVNLIYFNSSRMVGLPVQAILSAILIGWLSIRIISEFTAMVGDRGVTFNRILYFCALEILPHAILATALLRIPVSQ